MPRGGRLSDEALRALERAAAADPSRTLEWTRALERAGRADEAWLALCRAIDRPEVRAELEPRPAWTHEEGPGNTYSLDVPPIRGDVRVRWVTQVLAQPPAALVSPFGVVTRVGWPYEGDPQRFDVLDGRVRSGDCMDVDWLDGDLLVGHRRGDGPGVAIERLRGGGAVSPVGLADDGVPVLYRRGPGGFEAVGPLELPAELRSRSLFWPSASGGAGWLLAGPELDRDRGTVITGSPSVLVGPTRILVTLPHQRPRPLTVAFDPASRAPVWSFHGRATAVDGAGALLHEFEATGPGNPPPIKDRRLTCVDADGRPRWSHDEHSTAALGPDLVLASEDSRTATTLSRRFVAIDRLTGRLRSLGSELPHRCILVRDVVVTGEGGTVSANTVDGARLWELDVAAAVGPPAARVWSLAALPGALVVGLDGGFDGAQRLACLEGRVGGAPP